MENDPNTNVRRAIELAGDMKNLADEGEVQAPDGGCAVLFGVIRDCAYRIQGRAEQEAEYHRVAGIWNEEGENCDGRSRAAWQKRKVTT
jgi:hypothetical protein